ncbi:hypothetical protein CU097_015326 [Rhizopus azygosporus]|uniref:C3H1-type domain-containing protein n=1 Tax=Rhizopus azygosporus TaxID=86630 RepID=A0A367KDK7_RHIAZ|nr:hypothetical protein CU097_015326 [Rhizopus azygosporus]
MIIPQPPVSGHDSPGGSDMDVSDDEGEIPNPSSSTTTFQPEPEKESLEYFEDEDEDMESVCSYKTAPSSPPPSGFSLLDEECKKLTEALEEAERNNSQVLRQLSELKLHQEELKIKLLELQVRSSIKAARNSNASSNNNGAPTSSRPTQSNSPANTQSQIVTVNDVALNLQPLKKEYLRLDEEKRAAKANTRRMKKAMEKLRAEMTDVESLRNTHSEAAPEYEKKLSDLRANLQQAEKDYEGASADSVVATNRVVDFNSRVEKLGVKVADLKPPPVDQRKITDPQKLNLNYVDELDKKRRLDSENDIPAKRAKVPQGSSAPTVKQDNNTSPLPSKPFEGFIRKDGFRDFSHITTKPDFAFQSYEEMQQTVICLVNDLIEDHSVFFRKENERKQGKRTSVSNPPVPKNNTSSHGQSNTTEPSNATPLPTPDRSRVLIHSPQLAEIKRNIESNRSPMVDPVPSSTLAASSAKSKGKGKGKEMPIEVDIQQDNSNNANSVHFRPYRQAVESIGIGTGLLQVANNGKPLCYYEASGGQCNDSKCQYAHWRDFANI